DPIEDSQWAARNLDAQGPGRCAAGRASEGAGAEAPAEIRGPCFASRVTNPLHLRVRWCTSSFPFLRLRRSSAWTRNSTWPSRTHPRAMPPPEPRGSSEGGQQPSTPPGAPGRTWIVLGLLGALRGFSLAFVHLPAVVWAGNVGEFQFRFGDFLGPGLVLTAAGLAASAALLWLFRGRLRMVVACLVAAIALMAWVYGSFLVGDLTAFDGQAVPRAAAA